MPLRRRMGRPGKRILHRLCVAVCKDINMPGPGRNCTDEYCREEVYYAGTVRASPAKGEAADNQNE